MQVVITLSANRGRFHGVAKVKDPSPADTIDTRVIWFSPWQPTAESRDTVARAGPAQVRVQVLLAEKARAASRPVKTLDLGVRGITIH
jgi:hypothetical protein